MTDERDKSSRGKESVARPTARDVPFFGKPSLIGERLVELFIAGEIWRHVQVTLTEVVLGYAMGAAVGLALGFALGRSRMLSDIFQPYILAFYSIPKIALAPVFIVWLGLGLGSKIAVVALSTFFLSDVASPTPMLRTIFSRRGTCIGFL